MSKIICPKCGTENDEDAKFCINCGRLLLFESPAPPPPSEVKETRESIEKCSKSKCNRIAYYTCNKCGKPFCNEHIIRYKGLDYCEDCLEKIKNKEKIKVISLVALVVVVIIGGSFTIGSFVVSKPKLEVQLGDIEINQVKEDDVSFDLILTLENQGYSKIEIEEINFENDILNLRYDQKKERYRYANNNIHLNSIEKITLERGEIKKNIKIPYIIQKEKIQEKLQEIKLKEIKLNSSFLFSKKSDVKYNLSDINALRKLEPKVSISLSNVNSTVNEDKIFTRLITLENKSRYPIKVNIEIDYPQDILLIRSVKKDETIRWNASENGENKKIEIENLNLNIGNNTLKLECNATKCGEGKFIINIIDPYTKETIIENEKIPQNIISESNIYFSDESGKKVDKYYWPIDKIYVTVKDMNVTNPVEVTLDLDKRQITLKLDKTVEKGIFQNMEGIEIQEDKIGNILKVKYKNKQGEVKESTIEVHNAIDIDNLVIISDDENRINLNLENGDYINKKYSCNLDIDNIYELSFSILSNTNKVQSVEVNYMSENGNIVFESEDKYVEEISDNIDNILKLENIKKRFKLRSDGEYTDDTIHIDIQYDNNILIRVDIKIILK